jgi:hypothetical protein
MTEPVLAILRTDDGSLPDIEFDFGDAPVAAAAYDLIQRRATQLVSEESSYFSTDTEAQVPIHFGDNPAQAVIDGEAEPFHVVFGGLRSSAGAPIPDLGVFVWDIGEIALDYRMGPEWDAAGLEGLFELIEELAALASPVHISHLGNMFESDEGILLPAFDHWATARKTR